MKLASRLTVFFLAAQAVMLIGFSCGVYWLVARHFSQLSLDRLNATLATLSAATEMEPGGLKWEPEEREHVLRRNAGLQEVQWYVVDPAGTIIDQSMDIGKLGLPGKLPLTDNDRLVAADGSPWRSKILILRTRSAEPAEGDPDENMNEGHPGRRTEVTHPKLTLVALDPLAEADSDLRDLDLVLFALSFALWLIAAAIGRRLAQRALAPLTQMAHAAAQTGPDEPDTRLPVPATGDEVEELANAFNGLLDRLHIALLRQRRFTGDASHQLRTPLAGLLSQVEVALRHERSPEAYQRVLNLVHSSANELQQVVESMLFLARAESESAKPDLQSLELMSWTAEHMQTWAENLRYSDLRVEVDTAKPLFVMAHPALFAQLLDNLVGNACKYSKPGTPVVVRVSREVQSAVVSVIDHGIGLTVEEQRRLFEPFYRSQGAVDFGTNGIGLGLVIAQRICHAFGGSIRCQSESGQGSRFDLVLPEQLSPK